MCKLKIFMRFSVCDEISCPHRAFQPRYLSPKSGEKTTIKGVTPVSDGAFYYLLTWGEFGGWTRAPASSLGGYQTQCPTGANDVHYRSVR